MRHKSAIRVKAGLTSEKKISWEFLHGMCLKTPHFCGFFFPLPALCSNKICALLNTIWLWITPNLYCSWRGRQFKIFPYPVWPGIKPSAQKPPWSWSRVLSVQLPASPSSYWMVRRVPEWWEVLRILRAAAIYQLINAVSNGTAWIGCALAG